jgi:hypothetical protein
MKDTKDEAAGFGTHLPIVLFADPKPNFFLQNRT